MGPIERKGRWGTCQLEGSGNGRTTMEQNRRPALVVGRKQDGSEKRGRKSNDDHTVLCGRKCHNDTGDPTEGGGRAPRGIKKQKLPLMRYF